MTKRALRRHHRARVRAHARGIVRRWERAWTPYQGAWVKGQFVSRPVDFSAADARAAKLADHLAVCSCATCGNPRRHSGGPRLTRQERKAERRLREELEEIDRTGIDLSSKIDYIEEVMLKRKAKR